MSQFSPESAPVLAIARHCWDPPIRVKLLAFLEFSRGVDEGLADLVHKWMRRPAPCSRRVYRPLVL
ncbi:MAG: hypothetical protein RBS80_25040 [Thermoguttaceae bacterium]|nr:hypothetical protein [Thermoguttaceae bacterium]